MLELDIRDKQWMTKGDSAAPQRPRTRAYAKSHGLSIKNITLDDLDAATAAASSRRGSKAPSQSNAKQSTKKTSGKLKSTPTQPTRFVGKASLRSKEVSPKGQELRHSQQDVADKSTPQSDPPRPQTRENVSAWLDIISPTSPQISSPSRPLLHSDAPSLDIGGMESSSSAPTNRSTTNDEATSTKASTVKKSQISFLEHLEFRNIMSTPSNDPKLQALDLKRTIGNVPSHIEFGKFDSLMKVLDHFSHIIRNSIKHQSSENGLPVYDALRYQIGHWRPNPEEYRRIPPMPPEEFDWDREQCFNSSEADFHRTIMISIIDRYDLRGLFAFSCEEQWAVGDQFLIKPTRTKSKISQPKPDLALSFQRSALINDDNALDYPVELAKCLHPGVSGHDRWFPFVFIEAKKDDNSLRDAFHKALYAASQALFNIYQWMRLVPTLEEQFFDNVRAFTIVLNNENITLRIHRAVRDSEDRLRYKFAQVAKISDYGRLEVCHLVKSVLVDYGLPHLYPILKDTYKMVAKMDRLGETGGTKRKQAITDTQPPVQTTEEPSEIGLQSASTGISFDADNLDLSASGSNPKRSRRERRTGR